MTQVLLALIVIILAVTAGFIVWLIIEFRRTLYSLNVLLKDTNESIKPTLEELQQTLRSIRNVSDDLNDVTSDIKTLSGSVRDVGMNIKTVSNVIEQVTSLTAIRASGLRAGIRAGLEVLINNLFSRIGGRNERG
jgi:uncharacterized protein YoxC